MENVDFQQQTMLLPEILVAKLGIGIINNVSNVLETGLLIVIEFVFLLVIFADNPMQMDNVHLAIKDMI
ncbi:MAG: hypothetical protein ACKO96_39845 [Flammeovirgaceae bacterium]